MLPEVKPQKNAQSQTKSKSLSQLPTPTFQSRLEDTFPSLSTAQKKAAVWLEKNTYKAVFMSVKEIGVCAGVSDATVHRLSTVLGYPGFQDMKRELQEAQLENRTLRRLEKSSLLPTDSLMKKSLDIELNNIQHTFTSDLEQSIYKTADFLRHAKRIYVVGWRMGLSVATSFHYQLQFVLGNATLITSQNEVTEHLAFMNSEDVLLGVHFPRYSRTMEKMIEEARKRETTCVIFTDSPLCPSYNNVDIALLAATESQGFLDSYVTPLLISQMIIQTIAHQDPTRVKEQLKIHEQLFQTFGVTKS
ncbi:MurR/RpiR family transcriptional regulator [Evansella sp. AB-rgal1]|uniref:MurR/RpiR family transcriptional regulator n=1 Tax=Evansella sp. AB-rgal1 TaxID=3242696 RepID=UPI00359E8467